MNCELFCFSCSSSICCQKRKVDFALGLPSEWRGKNTEIDLNNFKHLWTISVHIPSQPCKNTSQPVTCLCKPTNQTEITRGDNTHTSLRILCSNSFRTSFLKANSCSSPSAIISALLSKATMVSNHTGEVLTLGCPTINVPWYSCTTGCSWQFSATYKWFNWAEQT